MSLNAPIGEEPLSKVVSSTRGLSVRLLEKAHTGLGVSCVTMVATVSDSETAKGTCVGENTGAEGHLPLRTRKMDPECGYSRQPVKFSPTSLPRSLKH